MEQQKQPILESRLHWFAYVGPVLKALVAIFLVQRYLFSGMRIHYMAYYISFIVLVMLTVKVLELLKLRWTLTDHGVSLERGLLPWQKSSYHLRFDQIFECFYVSGFLGRMLGFGTLVIRKSDGISTREVQPYLANPGNFDKKLESFLCEKSAHKNSLAPIQGITVTEELQKLIKLKNDGHISEEEFSSLKSKAMDR